MTAAQLVQLTRLAKRSGRTLDDVTEMWDERAAILEYEAGLTRASAERAALDDVANAVLR